VFAQIENLLKIILSAVVLLFLYYYFVMKGKD
jgi:hypothetical protein